MVCEVFTPKGKNNHSLHTDLPNLLQSFSSEELSELHGEPRGHFVLLRLGRGQMKPDTVLHYQIVFVLSCCQLEQVGGGVDVVNVGDPLPDHTLPDETDHGGHVQRGEPDLGLDLLLLLLHGYSLINNIVSIYCGGGQILYAEIIALISLLGRVQFDVVPLDVLVLEDDLLVDAARYRILSEIEDALLQVLQCLTRGEEAQRAFQQLTITHVYGHFLQEAELQNLVSQHGQPFIGYLALL